jgi:large subunit ribosomal protein L21
MESYAIVDIAGAQTKVTADAVVKVPKLAEEVGAKVSLDKVLYYSDGKKAHVGQPFVEGKAIKAEVVGHGRDDKVVVFKKKRRKNYKRTKGHRQQFTELRITTMPK